MSMTYRMRQLNWSRKNEYRYYIPCLSSLRVHDPDPPPFHSSPYHLFLKYWPAWPHQGNITSKRWFKLHGFYKNMFSKISYSKPSVILRKIWKLHVLYSMTTIYWVFFNVFPHRIYHFYPITYIKRIYSRQC